jgi:rod shape-determining protein MreD
VNALAFLVAYEIVSAQRRFFLGKSFMVMWWGFMLIAAGATAGTWLLVSGLSGAFLSPRPVVFQFLLTLALFPCLTWLFIRAQRVLLQQG